MATLEELHIYPFLPNVHNFMKEKIKGAILGPTGIGKSTGIIAYLKKLYPTQVYYISVPNISQAKNLAKRQKVLSPGIKIGYAGDLHPPPDNAQIVYATSEYVVSKVFEAITKFNQGATTNLGTGDILFIDEAHISSMDNYIIIKMWDLLIAKYEGSEGSKRLTLPRLYLLSTTLNPALEPNFEIFNIYVPSKPINIKYVQDYNSKDKRLYLDISKYIVQEHQLRPFWHTFMVFVPGRGDIRTLMKILEDKITKDEIKNIVPLEAHGDLLSADLKKIYGFVEGRKVIITTNIFESVVTIKDVAVVFDTTLEKRYDLEGSKLITVPISKASAIQRAGRTGRTMNGDCYRFCSRDTYEQLEDFRPLDIYNLPLDHLLIRLILTQLSYPEISQVFPSEIKAKLPETIKLLKNLNIIDDKGITDLGIFYNKFNLKPRVSAILYHWMLSDTDDKYPGLIVALMINNYNDSYLEYNWSEIKSFSGTTEAINKNMYKEKYFNKFKGISDLHTYMNAWLNLIKYCSTFTTINIRNKIIDWCKENSIKVKKFLGLYDMSNNLIIKLKEMTIQTVVISTYDTDKLIYEMTPMIRRFYNDKEFSLVERYYKLKDSNERYYLELSTSVNSFQEGLPKKIIGFSEFRQFNDANYKIVFALNIDSADLRVFSHNVKNVKTFVPRRAHPPSIKGVLKEVYIQYPNLGYDKIFQQTPELPEVSEQNYIMVGQKFPFSE